ncbi:UDP-N-acetylmuramoylalanine--D-glutamate ligase [Nosocomiicoccus sp. HMSC067E10]|uniref:UDP-N-acetylmuramoyl-L-alanine--D-glutamate ligase n=1 Tax=Nosocomiicoccus sp. HMSC067E10 TaxID=1739271 RepID=UPI0008A217E1|nr:UDP-N-acetylmuramoyl-L-alanine--D-glutamate ligase [Nosocomiicoccus sp. HMSC067E10]OFL48435.1 UDP-N-acetylmuramoylalanine--D-glutamate ligase [Nosocomiicoccus sp. HMSC067E10]
MKEIESFKHKKVLVLGYGRSGRSAIEALFKLGADITLTTSEVLVEESVLNHLKQMNVKVVDGHHPEHLLNDTELIVKNPGIPYTIPFLQEALKRNIKIITEVEFAYLITNNEIIGITGTNGKTTVTELVGRLLTDGNRTPILCGNIGYPASQAALEEQSDELVMELSSFQLMGIDTFRPNIAVFTNIYEAHLDYHKDLNEYQSAKLSLMKNMTDTDIVIFNQSQRHFVEHKDVKSNVYFFSIDEEADAYVKDNWIYVFGKKIINIEEILLKGPHNLENILASLLVAHLKNVPIEHMKYVLTTFKGIEHRMEFVDEKLGMRFYNDSKATNALATTFALDSFNTPTIWIAGGLDRGQDFKELLPHLKHVKLGIVFGETKEKLKQFLNENNIEVIETDNPFTAVDIVKTHGNAGDKVLFSPACASWDQYPDFETRGRHFKEAVHQL